MRLSNESIGECSFSLHLGKMCPGWNGTDFNLEVERRTPIAALARQTGSRRPQVVSCPSPQPMGAGVPRERGPVPTLDSGCCGVRTVTMPMRVMFTDDKHDTVEREETVLPVKWTERVHARAPRTSASPSGTASGPRALRAQRAGPRVPDSAGPGCGLGLSRLPSAQVTEAGAAGSGTTPRTLTHVASFSPSAPAGPQRLVPPCPSRKLRRGGLRDHPVVRSKGLFI